MNRISRLMHRIQRSDTGSSEAPYLTWETASDSIQKCINIFNNGDTVVVANGIYIEYLVIDSAIILLGRSLDSTVIDGTGLNISTIFTLKVHSPGYTFTKQKLPAPAEYRYIPR